MALITSGANAFAPLFLGEIKMLDNLEVRRVANGFVVMLNTTDGDSKEYIFESERKMFKFLRTWLLQKAGSDETDD